METKVDGRIEYREREEADFGCPGGHEGTELLSPDEVEISGEELEALLVDDFVDGYHEGPVWLAEELYSSALWEAPLVPVESVDQPAVRL